HLWPGVLVLSRRSRMMPSAAVRVRSSLFSNRRRHTRFKCDRSSDVCSSDLHSRPWQGAMAHGRYLRCKFGHESERVGDRKSVVEGKSVDLGGRRIIKKK